MRPAGPGPRQPVVAALAGEDRPAEARGGASHPGARASGAAQRVAGWGDGLAGGPGGPERRPCRSPDADAGLARGALRLQVKPSCSAAARRAWAALPLLPGRGWACARLASLGARCSFPRRNVVFVAGSSATARCRIRQVRSHSWVDLYLSSPCGLFLPSSCQSHVTVNVQWDLSRISPSTEITQTWPKACCGPASLSQASRADGTASDPGPRKTGGLGAVVPERLTLGPSLASSPVTVAVSRTVGF